jgi:Tol biopolymer transport system component
MTGTTFLLLFAVLLPLPAAFAQVAFISDRGGEMDIYVFDTDTSSLRRVTAPGEVEYGVTWSRDGAHLYFVTYKVGDQNIWRIRPDGSGLEQVTAGTHARNLNDISPDGKRMLINSKRETPQGDTYTMDLDGKNVRRITENEFFEAGAAYSPDGKTIVVSVQIAPSADGKGMGNAELYLYDAGGKELKRLTDTDSTFEALPSYSPDGKALAFHACDGAGCGIAVMNVATGKIRRLTEGDPDSRWPRWSPDGKWIAYTRRNGADTDVWLVRPDGSGKQAFIVAPGRDEIAAFGPKPVEMPGGK